MRLTTLLENQKYVGSYRVIASDGDFSNKAALDRLGVRLEEMTAVRCDDYENLVKALREEIFYGQPLRANGAVWSILYVCRNQNLTSLRGVQPRIMTGLTASNNSIESLQDVHKHVKEINGPLIIGNNPIKSHVLGLFMIKNLTKVFFSAAKADLHRTLMKVELIVNRYLPEGRAGLPKAQNELIEAGLEEYAQI